jgi:hypothetical protein
MVEIDSEVVRSAVEFWMKLYNVEEGTVKFIKKDGTIRIMKCTLNFKKIPKEHHPKKVDIPNILKLMQENGIIRVYDLERKGWRSVPFKQVDWLDVGDDKRYKIRPYKR